MIPFQRLTSFLKVQSTLLAQRREQRAIESEARRKRRDAARAHRHTYWAYCRDYDVEVRIAEIDRVLVDQPIAKSQHPMPTQEQIREVGRRIEYARAGDDPRLQSALARMAPASPGTRSPECILSLLIDHSGSMTGRAMLFATEVAGLLIALLEQLGIRYEMLGYTTTR